MKLATPRTAPEALRQATVFARAEQILADGYSFWPDADIDMIAVCKPGHLHADYWLTEAGTVCDCRTFAEHQDYCKHTMAWEIVKRTGLPQLASTSLDTIKRHVEERDRDAIAVARMAEMDEQTDGEAFMRNLHTERDLLR